MVHYVLCLLRSEAEIVFFTMYWMLIHEIHVFELRMEKNLQVHPRGSF